MEKLTKKKKKKSARPHERLNLFESQSRSRSLVKVKYSCLSVRSHYLHIKDERWRGGMFVGTQVLQGRSVRRSTVFLNIDHVISSHENTRQFRHWSNFVFNCFFILKMNNNNICVCVWGREGVLRVMVLKHVNVFQLWKYKCLNTHAHTHKEKKYGNLEKNFGWRVSFNRNPSD